MFVTVSAISVPDIFENWRQAPTFKRCHQDSKDVTKFRLARFDKDFINFIHFYFDFVHSFEMQSLRLTVTKIK